MVARRAPRAVLLGGSDTVLPFAIAAVLGYALGTLPAGVLLARLGADTDIRKHGSGSTGGTNVGRLLGWKAGAAVVALDAAKGYLAVWSVSIVGLTAPDEQVLPLVAGFSAVVGHVWPVWAGFRGGKGVATTAGVLLAVQPLALLAGLLVFAAVLAARRIVSLASLAAVVSVPLLLIAMRRTGAASVSIAVVAYALATAAVVVVAHRHNLARLRAGTEPTFDERGDRDSLPH